MRTAAGTLVLDALRSKDPTNALAALRDSRGASRLLAQLFVVALRRCFAGHDGREITRYVRDLLEWCELPPRGQLARRTEGLIRAVLDEPALEALVPTGCRYEIVCVVVGDLARPPGAPPGLIETLIEQAERRVDRYPEPAEPMLPGRRHDRLGGDGGRPRRWPGRRAHALR